MHYPKRTKLLRLVYIVLNIINWYMFMKLTHFHYRTGGETLGVIWEMGHFGSFS